ncbi:hypothetical protein Btru_066855 [Bulinus truncatus]|nr:hypothetical protein Btru_066855 [Bulinus truncatus]
MTFGRIIPVSVVLLVLTCTTEAQNVTCRFSDSILSQGTCFRFNATLASWMEAKAACESWNGALAMFNSSTQVAAALKNANSTSRAWCGANDIDVEGTWIWDHNKQPAIEMLTGGVWWPGEPTGDLSTWDCAKIFVSSFLAVSETCTNRYTSVCMELPLTTTTSTSTTTTTPTTTTTTPTTTTTTPTTTTTTPTTTTTTPTTTTTTPSTTITTTTPTTTPTTTTTTPTTTTTTTTPTTTTTTPTTTTTTPTTTTTTTTPTTTPTTTTTTTTPTTTPTTPSTTSTTTTTTTATAEGSTTKSVTQLSTTALETTTPSALDEPSTTATTEVQLSERETTTPIPQSVGDVIEVDLPNKIKSVPSTSQGGGSEAKIANLAIFCITAFISLMTHLF